MKDSINFSCKYDKLLKTSFPTIRGRMAYKDYSVGNLYQVTIKKKLFCHAVLLTKVAMKIKDISLHLLKKDTSGPELIPITSHEEFIKMMNSFREYHKIQSKEEWVTILWFRKVDKYKHGLGAFMR